MSTEIPENLVEYLYHGKEEIYLEYKGNVSWEDSVKKLEIVQTIFALSNERDGGVVVIGVKDDGYLEGLSSENYNSYSHDRINQFLTNKCNQTVRCKVDKFEHSDGDSGALKRFVFIQVSESKEFPLVYTSSNALIKEDVGHFNGNIGLRSGALYIRNKSNIGNKEISTTQEWEELIERTYKKYEQETLRRYSFVKKDDVNKFDNEINI
jgi:hypothetical protein